MKTLAREQAAQPLPSPMLCERTGQAQRRPDD